MDQRELLRELTESATLPEIQRYVQKQVELRGFDKESIGESMLLLLEETGELAKAIRKAATNMSVDADKLHRYSSVESEAADVFFVLLAVCNRMGVDLLAALREKEKQNCERNWSFERA